MKKKIIILGAGISGLSLGWFLKKIHGNSIDITILEKSSRAGGWIQTVVKDRFLFELGPRSCRPTGVGIHALELIEELGIQKSIILPDPAAQKRFIYINEHLQAVPNSLCTLLRSPFLGMILKACWKDWNTLPSLESDESIHSFFSRRLGRDIADTFADPMTSGIYAGDSHDLSIKSCFPELYRREKENGGLLRSVWKRRAVSHENTTPFIKSTQKAPLYSFQEGMELLPRTLFKQLREHVQLNTTVSAIEMDGNAILVHLASGEKREADQIISTLAARDLALIIDKAPELKQLLGQISFSSLAVINLGYRYPVLDRQGFGYLIPTNQKESVLGVVWDSSIFPQQNNSENQTRLTLMLGGGKNPEVVNWSDEELLNRSLKALYSQLSIKLDPNVALIHRACNAIPQYQVGHSLEVANIQSYCARNFPGLHLLGTSFYGVSINECIAQAQRFAQKFPI